MASWLQCATRYVSEPAVAGAYLTIKGLVGLVS
jgi:hypothetical protein